MYNFQFKNITILSSFTEEKSTFEKGVFLWIWHANKIPPHIGISVDGFYFSLKVNGKDESIPLSKIQTLIETKRIGTFVVEVNQMISKDDVKSSFLNHSVALSNQTTCLTPIQEILGFKDEKYILSELLINIQAKNALGKVFSINLERDFNGILAYGKEEIENRLKLLENVKRNKSIY